MIDIQDMTLTQGDFVMDGINLNVPTGQYAVLMGATGCGKTSLLEAICGLRHLARGRVCLGGRDVTTLKPASRDLGYVPQDGTLFATMSVRDNLGFALDVRKWHHDDISKRVDELASLLDITPLLDRSLEGLSGGERQRIALGRALAFSPSILLLDEPLSAVDEDTRDALCNLLKRVQTESDVTVLHVTHSQSEATRLADVLLQLNNGQVSAT